LIDEKERAIGEEVGYTSAQVRPISLETPADVGVP
jgi:hypothetical protein